MKITKLILVELAEAHKRKNTARIEAFQLVRAAFKIATLSTPSTDRTNKLSDEDAVDIMRTLCQSHKPEYQFLKKILSPYIPKEVNAPSQEVTQTQSKALEHRSGKQSKGDGQAQRQAKASQA